MASPDELYGKGNEAFVREEYALANEYYTKAIEIDCKQPNYYRNRANSHLKLKNFEETKSDVNKALELGNKESKLLLWKGMACFQLQDYQEADKIFSEGKQLEGENEATFDMWLEQCKLKLQECTVSKDEEAKIVNIQPVKVRHDWYQTELNVVVTILVKNATQNDVSVQISNKCLQCNVKGNDKRSDFELDIEFEHEINAPFSTWKILPSKIEISLKKMEGLQWKTLHKTQKENIKHFIPESSSKTSQNYPTSCAMKKDWDKIVTDIKKDEETEQQDGEAAVNQLFQKIYAEGSDEVKKAMNKSFTESGGTVLSTNWGDVGKKKITVKPPDGMEWKHWDN